MCLRPTIEVMTAPEPKSATATPNTPPKKPAILVIDDETTLLEVFAAALSTRFEVTTASSVREAEFILYKKALQGVVIADHLMPGSGNGMSFLVRVREEYPLMQRFIVTGYNKPEMLLRSVNEAALFPVTY